MSSNWKHDRRTSKERGYGHAWKKLRHRAMTRDQWLCQPCLRQGRTTPATECDHIVNKAQGGSDSLSNLQAICAPCHREKTAREAAEAQGRYKPRMEYDASGFPVWQ